MAGMAPDAAALRTQTGQYGGTAATQAGQGRIVSASIEGGADTTIAELVQKWEGEAPDKTMIDNHDALLKEYDLTRDSKWKVRSDFDIVLRFSDTPVVVPPVRPRTDDDKR